MKLLAEIEAIKFKFEDPKYMTLSIQKSKANFYSYKQHDLENFQCLEKFHNLVQILALNDDNLYCKVIIDYVVQQIYSKKSNDITPGHLN